MWSCLDYWLMEWCVIYMQFHLIQDFPSALYMFKSKFSIHPQNRLYQTNVIVYNDEYTFNSQPPPLIHLSPRFHLRFEQIQNALGKTACSRDFPHCSFSFFCWQWPLADKIVDILCRIAVSTMWYLSRDLPFWSTMRPTLCWSHGSSEDYKTGLRLKKTSENHLKEIGTLICWWSLWAKLFEEEVVLGNVHLSMLGSQ